MPGLGTVINAAFILLGSFVGILLKKGIHERLQTTVIHAIGLSTCFIGIAGVLSKMLIVGDSGYSLNTQGTMLLVLSLVLGALAGECINIEKRLEKAGEFCRTKIKLKNGNDTFVEGFVSASLLFCVGAMAIVGSLEDGLNGDISTLFAKSVMDGTVSIFYGATMGVGVCFSVVPVVLYQGAITLLAGVIQPYLSQVLIDQISMVGSVLIFGIGINMLCKIKLRLGNMLPAILVPPLYLLLQKLWQVIF